MIKKVIILGGGPAGYTASIYLARSKLYPVLITGINDGGQIIKSSNIENWPGEYKNISGIQLAKKFKKQALKFKVNIIYDQIIETNLKKIPIKLTGENNTYYTETLIIATGSIPRKLGLPLEDKFYGKGISTCATCDGYFYKNKNVAIIGGGNSAIEEALFLCKISKKIYLIYRNKKFKAEKYLIKKIKKKIKKKKIILYRKTILLKIQEKNENINSLIIKNLNSNKKKHININGLFIAIGYIPNTKIFKKQILLDKDNYIITNINTKFKTMTNINGIFAAGDVIDKIYKQAITSSATGCMAAIDLIKYLENK